MNVREFLASCFIPAWSLSISLFLCWMCSILGCLKPGVTAQLLPAVFADVFFSQAAKTDSIFLYER